MTFFFNAIIDLRHPEERPLRDAARGGSSGQRARLEGREVPMQLYPRE
jgi:hypothetical protein